MGVELGFSNRRDAIETAQYLSRKTSRNFIVVEKPFTYVDHLNGDTVCIPGFQVVPAPNYIGVVPFTTHVDNYMLPDNDDR